MNEQEQQIEMARSAAVALEQELFDLSCQLLDLKGQCELYYAALMDCIRIQHLDSEEYIDAHEIAARALFGKCETPEVCLYEFFENFDLLCTPCQKLFLMDYPDHPMREKFSEFQSGPAVA